MQHKDVLLRLLLMHDVLHGRFDHISNIRVALNFNKHHSILEEVSTKSKLK